MVARKNIYFFFRDRELAFEYFGSPEKKS